MRTSLRRFMDNYSKVNSLRKYLFYALGEIALIVFSLFLAFQLNDLNDRNNEKKLRETYTRLLIKDYQTDLEQIRAARSQFLREIQLIDSYGIRLGRHYGSQDTIIKIVGYEYNPNVPPFVRYNNTTLETLKETGHLELISSKALKQINTVQLLQTEQQLYQKTMLDSHTRLLESYLGNYPLKNGVLNEGQLYTLLWEGIDSRDLLLEFNALITTTRSVLTNATFYYDKIEVETTKAIELLQHQ